MNRLQNSRLDCLNLIVYEAEKHAAAVALIPAFEADINTVKGICVEISSLKPKQEIDLTGITNKKNQVKEDLAELLADLSGAVQAHAYEQKNQVLFESAGFTLNTLSTMKKTDLISTAEIIISQAETMTAEELTTHGFTAEEMAQVKTYLSDYKAQAQEPRRVIIDRSGYTAKIEELIEKAWKIKKEKLDRLVSQFKRKDPDFYLKYNAASQVSYQRRNKINTNGEQEVVTENESVKS